MRTDQDNGLGKWPDVQQADGEAQVKEKEQTSKDLPVTLPVTQSYKKGGN